MKIKDPPADRTFYVLNYAVLIVFVILVLYPLIYVLSASFSSASAIANNEVRLLPVGFNTQAYSTILASPSAAGGLRQLRVVHDRRGTDRHDPHRPGRRTRRRGASSPFRRVILFFFVIPTLVSAGIVPTYIVVQQLGLLDTRWAILLPGAMSVFNVIITRTFYEMTVPQELLEAGQVDGASDFRFFLQVALCP